MTRHSLVHFTYLKNDVSNLDFNFRYNWHVLLVYIFYLLTFLTCAPFIYLFIYLKSRFSNISYSESMHGKVEDITTHIVIMSVCFTWVEQVDEAYSEKLTHRKYIWSENAREGIVAAAAAAAATAIIDELYSISVTGLCSFYNVTLACTLSYHRSCVKLTEKGNMLTYYYIFLFNTIIIIINNIYFL